MKLIKNKVLRFSILCALLFSVSAPHVASAMNAKGFVNGVGNTVGLGNSGAGIANTVGGASAKGAGFFSGVKSIFKNCTEFLTKHKFFSIATLFVVAGVGVLFIAKNYFENMRKEKLEDPLKFAIKYNNFKDFKALLDENSNKEGYLRKAIFESCCAINIKMVDYIGKNYNSDFKVLFRFDYIFLQNDEPESAELNSKRFEFVKYFTDLLYELEENFWTIHGVPYKEVQYKNFENKVLVKKVLDKNSDEYKRKKESGYCLLSPINELASEAAYYRNLKLVKYLIKTGIEREIDFSWRNLLALSVRDIDVMKFLMESGANKEINLPGCHINQFIRIDQHAVFGNLTPLALACYKNQFETVRYLIENGADVKVDFITDRDHGAERAERAAQGIVGYPHPDNKCFKTVYVAPLYLLSQRISPFGPIENCEKFAKYLIDNGANIDENKNYGILDAYVKRVNKKQNKLYSKVGELINASEIILNTALNKTSVVEKAKTSFNKLIIKIKKIFDHVDTPLYAKQMSLSSLLDLYKEDENSKLMITSEEIIELYGKIDFNYTFFNDSSFKNLVDFAINKNNILDSNSYTVKQEALIYGGQKGLAKFIENSGDFYVGTCMFRRYSESRSLSKCLSKKPENLLSQEKPKEEETQTFKDYCVSLGYLEMKKEKNKFRDLANASLFMDIFAGKPGTGKVVCKLQRELVANIAAFGVPDNGGKLLV